jgi:asparagine synthase (glutamine-hydrolysing)
MCGISGVLTTQLLDSHQHILNLIVKDQLARGPDHQAITKIKTNSAEVLLGHNRLSIIDLSAKANQPMCDPTGRFCIVFNGEIYNYIEIREELREKGLIFNTHSDTEVILNAFSYWGILAVNYFRGPFAFALFDKQKEELWLCRDRFGVRPLYYLQRDNTLYFASSVSVLAKHFQLKPNMNYLAQGLHYLVYEDGSVNSPYEMLLSLEAGCYVKFKFASQGTLHAANARYYHLDQEVENTRQRLSTIHERELLPLVMYELENSIAIRLRTDVPFAISLSGGLDSSSIASLIKNQHDDILGFSFSHPRERKTEGPIVANCGNFLKIPIEYVWPTATDMIEGLFKTLQVQEAPFSSLSVVAQYLLYERVKSFGFKILVGGQGGDESFMGYKKFLIFSIKNFLHKKHYFAACKQTLQLIPMLFAELSALPAYWQHRQRFLNSKKHSTVLNLPSSSLQLSLTSKDLWRRQALDILKFSLPTLLRYEDRNAMGHSVESRLPYMDHRLVELGLALPESLKLKYGYGKWIIRDMMKNKLPNNIRLARFKRGFDIPVNTLLKAGLGAEIRMHLKHSGSLINDYFKSKVNIDQHYSDQQLLRRRTALSEMITLLWLDKGFA